jgi:hypothetical protein
MDDYGRWGVRDTAQPLPALMAACRYADHESADAFADVLNAVDEGEPAEVLGQLRAHLDKVRAVAPLPGHASV